jgi:hypothetical protein
VIANYRFGSGADAPAAGTLTNIMQAQPGLKAILNPIVVGGGADPDPPSRIRTLAPRSVLTFGRAVSADDYEVIAAQAPGVARAKSAWSYDPQTQKAQPLIYVGDDDNAVDAARKAITLAADPNRPFTVRKARKIRFRLTLTVIKAAEFATDPVRDAVKALLCDPDNGWFGSGRVGISETFYRSQIEAAALTAPGAAAIHDVSFFVFIGGDTPLTGPKFDPGVDAFFFLQPEDLTIEVESVPT